jgi:mono/diheme cytochrome c family protein
MKNSKLWLLAFILLVLLVAACGKAEENNAQTAAPAAGLSGDELAAEAIQKGGCSACHIIPGIPGAVVRPRPPRSTCTKLSPIQKPILLRNALIAHASQG